MNALILDTSPARVALDAAEEAWTAAVQAAVRNGDWGHVRQAAEVAHQCRAALTAGREA